MRQWYTFYRWISKWCVPLEYLIDEYRIDISPLRWSLHSKMFVFYFLSDFAGHRPYRRVIVRQCRKCRKTLWGPATGKNTFNSKRSLDFGLGIFKWNFYGMFIQKRGTTGGFFFVIFAEGFVLCQGRRDRHQLRCLLHRLVWQLICRSRVVSRSILDW